MVFTIKTSIQNARKSVSHLKGDGLITSIGDIWSIKKLLLLDYYIPSFKLICSAKYHFDKWYYADPFCGSGLFTFKDADLENEIYSGSALLGAFSASKSDYTDCILSDIDPKNIDALNERLSKSKIHLNGKTYHGNPVSFDIAVENILKHKKFGTAILVFVDPKGYSPIKWCLMEKLVNEVGIDIVFNFMTYTIALNASASKKKQEHEKNLNEFFGDDGWKQFLTTMNKDNLGEQLLAYYITKIQKINKKNVIRIGVYREGDKKLYDLLVITRSGAGTKVIETAKRIMDNATTEAIYSEFQVQIKKQYRLSDFGM